MNNGVLESRNVKIHVSFNISRTVLVNPMNKLRTVHGTVHEHHIKHIIGTAQEQTHRNLFGTIVLELMKKRCS